MILLVGAGYMAIEYAKVLKAMKKPFIVVGRSRKSAKNFKKITGIDVVSGGLSSWIKKQKTVPKIAIVAVSVNQLSKTTTELLSKGAELILVEKPGGMTAEEIKTLSNTAKRKKSRVYVAYNRRFYASTKKAIEIVKKNDGVKSFTFDFTELSHQIGKLKLPTAVKENWFLANSSHVVDLAFFLGGKPADMRSYKSGSLRWHSGGSIFVGAGISEFGAPFSYSANWASPGRWGLEVFTSKSRLIFRPLEKLQIQRMGDFAIEEVSTDDKLDKKFKPGIYRQTESFLSNRNNLITIEKQAEALKFYNQIINGSAKT